MKGIDIHIRFQDGEKLDLKGARHAAIEGGFYTAVWAHDNGDVTSIRRFHMDSILSVEETVIELRPESHLVVAQAQVPHNIAAPR